MLPSGIGQNTETEKQIAVTTVMQKIMKLLLLIIKNLKPTVTVCITIPCRDFLVESKVGTFIVISSADRSHPIPLKNKKVVIPSCFVRFYVCQLLILLILKKSKMRRNQKWKQMRSLSSQHHHPLKGFTLPNCKIPYIMLVSLLRYYGRKKGNESDSELSIDSDGSVEEPLRWSIWVPNLSSHNNCSLFSVSHQRMVKMPVKGHPTWKSVWF